MKQFYFEVSVSRDGGKPDEANRFNFKDRCHWVRKGRPRKTHFEAMQDAITNGERPYRIKSEEIKEVTSIGEVQHS